MTQTIISLLSVLVAAVGIYLAHLFSMQRADVDLRLRKAEELLRAVRTYVSLVQEYLSERMFTMPPENVFGAEEKKTWDVKCEALEEIAQTLIDIYFPNLEAAWKNVFEIRTKGKIIVLRAQKDWHEPVLNREDYAKLLQNCFDNLTSHNKEFGERVRIEVARLRADSLIRWLMDFFSY